MPRPKKSRRVCSMPQIKNYGPIDEVKDYTDAVIMLVEELETIRLIDLEGRDQVQCAEIMGVARSTVQRIYNDARKKVAESLVKGKALVIEGGNYKVCNENLDVNMCNNCFRRRRRRGRNL